ncbi:hypothetical protein AALM99_04330 [Lactococcus muris]|uniref:Phage protein n=1 Tax=Lactococcus muris TaxID=2941330 RepID=A0ABV4DBZ0_9LACT
MTETDKMRELKKKFSDLNIDMQQVDNKTLIDMGKAQGESPATYPVNGSISDQRKFFRSIYAPLISEAVIESKHDIKIMMNGVYGIMLKVNGKEYEVMYLAIDKQKTSDGIKDISFAQFVSLIERYNRRAENPVLITLEKMKKVLRTAY